MVGELVPVPVDPARAASDFWSRYHVLRRLRHAEMDPDDPLEPDEVAEARMKKRSPFDEPHYFEMSREGVMISLLYLENPTPTNPEYETNKHLVWGDIYVLPDHRRRGIATSWLPVIVGLMREKGATVFSVTANRDSGFRFLESLGAEAKLKEVESRLKLAEVDWPMMRRWVEEGAKRSASTRLVVYDGPLPDDVLPAFAQARTELLNTIPFEDLDQGDIIVTPERIRYYDQVAAAIGEVVHNVITWERDGSVSAMTDVTWAPYRRTLIHQEFTGVRPDTRGRGLGKWIKAAMVLHIRDLYPDAEWITTGNAGSNAPMLKINRAMGFKPYRPSVDHQVSRDQLEARITSA